MTSTFRRRATCNGRNNGTLAGLRRGTQPAKTSRTTSMNRSISLGRIGWTFISSTPSPWKTYRLR